MAATIDRLLLLKEKHAKLRAAARALAETLGALAKAEARHAEQGMPYALRTKAESDEAAWRMNAADLAACLREEVAHLKAQIRESEDA